MSLNNYVTGNISELHVCRGCLATDARLYDMRQNLLLEAYSNLLCTADQVTEDLPHYLCSYCAALLLKCDTFKTNCINSQSIFRNAQCQSPQLTIEKLKQTDRITHLAKSNILTINIDENLNYNDNVENIQGSTDIGKCSSKTIKVEHDCDTNDAIGDNGEIKALNDHPLLKKILDNNLRKSNVETVSNKQLKLEDLISDSKSNIVVNKQLNSINGLNLVHINEVTNETPLDCNNTYECYSDTEDEIAIADLKKLKSCNKTQVRKSRITRNSKSELKNKEKPENLSKMYNMEDIDLSKEEQLKEFEDRKTSNSYLQATFKCDVCFKGFLMEETCNSHMLIHDDKCGKHVCEICSSHFMNIHRLNRHKSNHKKRYKCKECGFITKYLSQAKEHFNCHGGVKDNCKYCGKEFSRQSTYYLHLKVKHPTSDELVHCEICGESCNGVIGLTLHEKRAHKEMYAPECHCLVCETQFYCSDAFKAHRGTDGVCDTTHKYCVRCGESFETEELLKEHEMEQRKPRTSIKCEVCHKIYRGMTSYKKHLTTHSSSLIRTRDIRKVKKLTVCEICGKVLANKYILKQHYGIKHSTESPYQCTECPKSFRSAPYLQLHKRTHSGERPYQCPHCSKSFKTYTNMKRHTFVHTGERPHTCDLCGKSFQTKDSVKLHIKTVHMKIPMPPRIRRKHKKTE